MRLKILICFLLAGITLAIYWPTGHFEAIDLDDLLFLSLNDALQVSWHGIARAMTMVVSANWHPVTNLSFILMHACFGLNPGAEHLLNAVFHAVNTALLFLVLLRMTGATWRSAAVAAIFAWHPLRVESVAWISERKDVLYVFFMLLSLLCYERYARLAKKSAPHELPEDFRSTDSRSPMPSPAGRGSGSGVQRVNIPGKFFCSCFCSWIGWYALSMVFFALSFMSKGTVVTLPFLLLLLDAWPLQRLNRSTLRPLIVEKIPFFALTIFFCALTFWIHKTHADVTTMQEFGPDERIENAILSYVKYLGLFFWPTDLALPYPYPASFDVDQVLLAALLLIGISILCLSQVSRRPYLAVGWFWYLGTMVPVIGLVQIGQQAMADRHTYVPLIGPAVSLVWLISEWAGPKKAVKSLAASTTAIILVACVISTRIQLSYWRNSVSLFGHSVAVTPANFLAESCLAYGLQERGRIREAATQYQVVLSLTPINYLVHYNLAQCLEAEGCRRQALAEYQTAVAEGCNPDDYAGDLNIADALIKLERPAEATPYMEAVLRFNPDSVQELNNLAWLLATCPDASARNGTRAVQLAERACELTHYQLTFTIGTLAAAYAEAGRFDDAVATAQKAVANAKRDGETELAQRNEEMLALYSAHKAYHEPIKSDKMSGF